MVRPQPRVVPLQIELSRVMGWSTALALHVLALMLLLIPAAYVAVKSPPERMTARWIAEPLKPLQLPPAPPRDAAEPPPKVTPVIPHTMTSPLPLPTATNTDTLAVPPLPASETQAPSLAAAAPVPASSGEGVQLQYRSAPPPAYPIAAIRNHEQGTVLLRVRVEADGRASSVVIERSSGSRTLDNAARQQVLRQWRFVPAVVDGQQVPADGLVPVSFSLPD